VTQYNLFAVFKVIVDEFSSDKDKFDSFLENVKHFFYKGEMHDALYYYGGETVKVAPTLRPAEYPPPPPQLVAY
jgi:hypothetical protein